MSAQQKLEKIHELLTSIEQGIKEARNVLRGDTVD